MPFFIAAAVAASTVGSSIISSNAASDAAASQSQASEQANQLQAQALARQQANLAPYQQAGLPAVTALQQGLGLMPGSTGAIGQGSLNTPFSQQAFQASPAYQFELQQGSQSAENAASRTGGLGGNQLLALQRQGQGLAQMDYQQQLQNYQSQQQQQYNQLMGLTGIGQASAAGVGAAQQQYANQVGSNLVGAANAQGAAGIAGANAITGAIGGGVSSLSNAMMMQQLYGGSGGVFGQPLVSSNYTMTGAPLPTTAMDFASSPTTVI